MSVVMTLLVRGVTRRPIGVDPSAEIADTPMSMGPIVKALEHERMLAASPRSIDGCAVDVRASWMHVQPARFGQADIAPMMEAAGATRSRTRFWRELETHDAYGWGA